MTREPTVLVMMGVAGAGKTTVGKAVARRLGWSFTEGDDIHPPANVAKMRAGHPLDDADRAPWLAAIGRRIDAWIDGGQSGVVTCSALKRAYRDRLRQGRPTVRFVSLEASADVVARRMAGRAGHFMPASLVRSQFADLESPEPSEAAIVVKADAPLAEQVDEIVAAVKGAP